MNQESHALQSSVLPLDHRGLDEDLRKFYKLVIVIYTFEAKITQTAPRSVIKGLHFWVEAHCSIFSLLILLSSNKLPSLDCIQKIHSLQIDFL